MGDVSYKRLWKLLIDRDMKKKDLIAVTGISAASVAKLTRGDNVQTDVLVKICRGLNCDFENIMEMSSSGISSDKHTIVTKEVNNNAKK